MDNTNNTFGWVAGIVIVILIILGIWWFMQANPAGNTNGTATTTPQAATSTNTGTNATPVSTETRSSATVNAVVASLTGVSTFQAMYVSTGVSASVTGKGPYTVFVPTDAAMGALPAGTIRNLTAAQQKRLVQNHVIVGKMLDLDAVSSGTYTSLSKDTLNFNVQPQTKIAYVGSGYAIKQIKASNGMVYVITAVLTPPQTPNPNTGSTGTPVPH
jgi:uncharacterized surface protein with fasciclin (FAS1) repeats